MSPPQRTRPAQERPAVGAKEVPELLSIPLRTWRRLDRDRLCPAALWPGAGRRKIWFTESLREWLRLGCPSRHKYEVLTGGHRNDRAKR